MAKKIDEDADVEEDELDESSDEDENEPLEKVPKDENEPLEKIDNLDTVIWTKEIVSPPTWIDKSWNFRQTGT